MRGTGPFDPCRIYEMAPTTAISSFANLSSATLRLLDRDRAIGHPLLNGDLSAVAARAAIGVDTPFAPPIAIVVIVDPNPHATFTNGKRRYLRQRWALRRTERAAYWPSVIQKKYAPFGVENLEAGKAKCDAAFESNNVEQPQHDNETQRHSK